MQCLLDLPTPPQGNDCLLATEKHCIKMYICLRLYVARETNTDRQAHEWT